MRKSICCESESSPVFHFAGSAHECSKGGASHSSTHADPLYSDSSQFLDRKGSALQAHNDVDRPGNGLTHLADGFEARQPRRIKNICASVGKGLQAPYGIAEIGAAMEEVLGSCRQHEPTIVSGLCRRRGPL